MELATSRDGSPETDQINLGAIEDLARTALATAPACEGIDPAAVPDLMRGCQAAIAYLADPPSKFPENRAEAVRIINDALDKAGAK